MQKERFQFQKYYEKNVYKNFNILNDNFESNFIQGLNEIISK